jgi:acylphosphatase
VSGCGFEEALKSVASQHGATGWVMQNPYLHMEGEIFGSLQQCNAMETWLSSWKPPMDAHVSELRIPDSRRMLFRQRVFDEFRVEYYL